MRHRCLFVAVLACLAISALARADSIVVDGVRYTGVTLKESETRYYFVALDGRAVSVSKDRLGPNDVVLGDGPLPETEPQTPHVETPVAEPAPAAPVVPPAPEPESVPAPAAPVVPPAPEPESVPVPAPPVVPPEPESVPVSAAPEPVPAAPPEVTRPAAPLLEPVVLAPHAPLSAGAAHGPFGEPSHGLEADALVLRAGAATVAFVSVDAAVVSAALRERVLAGLEEASSSVGPEGLVLCATGRYTPAQQGLAGGVMEAALFGKYDEERCGVAAASTADVLLRAERGLQDARIVFGETELPELHASRLGPDASLDSTLSVARVDTAEGAPIAYVFNYALYPPVSLGAAPQPGRGAPGALALALRAAQADAAVLFQNGAAGDVTPDFGQGEELPGQLLAEAGLAALNGATPEREVSLTAVARTLPTPPTLLGPLVSAEALLQEVYINGAVFVAIPAAPSAQSALLLRVKAMAQGFDRAFVLSQANGNLGFLPATREYFAATPETRLAHFGPLMGKWLGEHCLVSDDDVELWRDIPELSRFEASFLAAVERGVLEQAAIRDRWEQAAPGLTALANLARSLAPIPEEYKSLLAGISAEDAAILSKKVAATFVRMEFADFSEEDRVRLMGVAEGAGLPFDAILLLQFLSDKSKMTEQVRAIVQMMEEQGNDLRGFDFLS